MLRVPISKDLNVSSQSIPCTAVVLTIETGNDNHTLALWGHHAADAILGFEQQLISCL